jgi:capsular exopolysaccharide synthesis family protein
MQRAGVPTPAKNPGPGEDVFVSPWDTTGDVVLDPEAPEPTPRRRLLVGEPRPNLSWSSRWRERCVASSDADPVLVEQFRRMAAVLHNAQATSGVRAIMLTSAAQGDGKTSTALNLALVLSESYQHKVLLIDADLRRPSLGGMLELSDGPGLGEALKAQTEQKLSVMQITPTFTLLPGGRPDPDPMRGLTSPRMRQILDEAREHFDWVIVDAPPMGPAADAQFLADMVDAVVFVIRAGHTQHAEVEKAIGNLGRERILGIVLNGVEQVPGQAYYGTLRENEKA